MQASPDSERSIAESMSRLYISDKGYIRGISKLKEICPFLTRNTLYNLLLENNMDFEAAKAFALNLASQFLDRKRFRQPSRERESCLGRAPPQSKLKSDWDFNDSYFDWDSYATSDSEYDRYLDKRDQVLGRKSPGTPTQARRRKKERTHAQKSKSYSKSRRMARGERSESDSVRDFVTSDGSYASDWSGTYMPSNSSTSSSSSLRNGHSLESQPSCTDSEGCRMASNSGLTNDEDDLEIDMENPWGNL